MTVPDFPVYVDAALITAVVLTVWMWLVVRQGWLPASGR
jgi:hypothetical protein